MLKIWPILPLEPWLWGILGCVTSLKRSHAPGPSRVSQNFKHEKFIWDQVDSYSLRKRNAEKCKDYQNPTTFKGAR